MNRLIMSGLLRISYTMSFSIKYFFLIAFSYMYTPVAAMCFLPNFAPRRVWQAFMRSHLCTYSHSYIRYFLNFLSVIDCFTIEQLSFTACFGGLLSYTYAAAAICFLLNYFCTCLFTPCWLGYVHSLFLQPGYLQRRRRTQNTTYGNYYCTICYDNCSGWVVKFHFL